jgi:hypothetical protein
MRQMWSEILLTYRPSEAKLRERQIGRLSLHELGLQRNSEPPEGRPKVNTFKGNDVVMENEERNSTRTVC